MAKGDEESNEEEDESTLVVGSPMHVELWDSSKQVDPEVGTGDVGTKGSVEPVMSQEDITKD